jgi:DNA modification methylase
VVKERVESDLKENPYCSVIALKSVPTGHFIKDSDSKIVNPYQKPLSLYLRLLKMFAHPDSVILDITCGTGSLEVAALEPTAPDGLMIIAFEKSNYQAEQARIRLGKVTAIPTDKNSVPVDVALEKRNAAPAV